MTPKAVMFDFYECIGYYDEPSTKIFDESLEMLHAKVREWGYSGSIEQFKEINEKVFLEYNKTEEKTRITVNESEIYKRLAVNLFKTRIAPSKIYELEQVFWNGVFPHTLLYQDALTILKILRDRGIRLAIVANWRGTEFFFDFLKKVDVIQLFDQVITSEMVGYAKPHPEIFSKAMRLLEVSGPEVVFVGNDPEVDVNGALGAGMKAVLLDRNGKAQPPSKSTPKIRIMSEIFDAFGKL